MMNIIDMLYDAKFTLTDISELCDMSSNAMSNKKQQGLDLTREQMEKISPFLEKKIKELIKIKLRIDKLLNSNK